MRKKGLTMLCTATLTGTFLVTGPAGAIAAPEAHSPAHKSIPLSIGPDTPPDHFEACAATGIEAPRAIALGESLGSGISEKIDKDTLKTLNGSLISSEKKPLPADVHAMRYLDSGRIVALNQTGDVIQESSAASTGQGLAPGFG